MSEMAECDTPLRAARVVDPRCRRLSSLTMIFSMIMERQCMAVAVEMAAVTATKIQRP